MAERDVNNSDLIPPSDRLGPLDHAPHSNTADDARAIKPDDVKTYTRDVVSEANDDVERALNDAESEASSRGTVNPAFDIGQNDDVGDFSFSDVTKKKPVEEERRTQKNWNLKKTEEERQIKNDLNLKKPVEEHHTQNDLNQKNPTEKPQTQKNPTEAEQPTQNDSSQNKPEVDYLEAAIKPMSNSGDQPLEELIASLGGFGPYQFLLMSTVWAAKMSVAYSVVLMAFAAATPHWWCQTPAPDASDSRDIGGGGGVVVGGGGNGSGAVLTAEQCVVNGTLCQAFRYSASLRSIVSEWDLVCQRSWTTSVITSVQMAGLVVGAALAGQLADVWGRRNTFYLTLLLQAIFSLASGFCNSWQLFIVCRFFTGMGSGGFVVVYYALPLEFLSPRWRSVLTAIPTWTFGIGILSLAAWLSRDWRWLNWIGAAFSGVFLLAYPFTPESLRWLVLHDRMEEAEKVIRKVVAMNRKQMPDLEEVRQIARREAVAVAGKRRRRAYTYLDLFGSKKLTRVTLCFNFTWFCCGLVYYALSFGAEQLSGSLYLNMVLIAAVEIPPQLITPLLANRLGRRWTNFLFFAIACVSASAAVIVSYVNEAERGTAVKVLVLLCKMGLFAAWSCMQLFANESFPTVVRSVGYGSCNVSSRVGGFLAPYLVLLGSSHFELMYVLVAVLTAGCAVVTLFCPESSSRALEDTMADFLASQETRDLSRNADHAQDTSTDFLSAQETHAPHYGACARHIGRHPVFTGNT